MSITVDSKPAEFILAWFSWSYWFVLVLFVIVYTVAVVVYRLTIHPLAKFPGPRLAGASYCYEFWFDVVLGGRYTRKIGCLHEQYGPIVRINPNEVHCNDPDAVDLIYSSGRSRRNKSSHYLAALPWDLRQSGVGTADHDQHRLRRSALNKYFSRSQVLKREDFIQQAVQHLCNKLLLHRGQGPFEAAVAYSCLTTDVITDYSFGHSLENLHQPGWRPAFKGPIDNMTAFFYLSRHFPPLSNLANWLPLSLGRGISNEIGTLLEMSRITIPELVTRAKSTSDSQSSERSYRTVVQTLLDSNLPPIERTPQRLSSEGFAIALGGTHTISTVLTVITYHLLANPNQLDILRKELQATIPDATELPSWSTLEKLPYLSAVILEGIRLMYGVASRISVIAPDEDLLYQASWKPANAVSDVKTCHTIPRGYAIGMSAYLMHSDPRLFPNASQFLPGRWLDGNGQRAKVLERYLLSFTKGNRQCVGMQLAYCELYVATAALALRVFPQMSLHQTTITDVEYDHDQMIAMPKKGSKGVRVIMHD